VAAALQIDHGGSEKLRGVAISAARAGATGTMGIEAWVLLQFSFLFNFFLFPFSLLFCFFANWNERSRSRGTVHGQMRLKAATPVEQR
jgi:hypothetical protein